MRRSVGTVIFVIYLAATLVRWNFQFHSGRMLMAVGLRLRRWIPNEFAHTAFLHTLRWTYWQPEWVDRDARVAPPDESIIADDICSK